MSRTAITSLRLSHYRSYKSALVETGGSSIALHGPNGSGKTNLLEAVSLLVPGRGLRRAATEELGRVPERIGWKIGAAIETSGGGVDVVTGADGPGATRRTVEIDDKPAPQTALGRLLSQVWLTPAMDRLWTDPAGERRRFMDRITMGFEPGHAEAALAYEKAMRERNRLLRDGHDDDAWLGGLEAQMARAGARIARARAASLHRLKQAQLAATSLFPKAELTILGDMEARFSQAIGGGLDPCQTDDGIEAEEAAGLARALARGRARDAAAGRTLDGPHRSDLEAVYAEKGMPARACSTGEQKALLISICLGNARALFETTGRPPILLLDEIAAHLDAARRRALYREVAELGCQSWLTGTSEALFDGLEGAIRVGVSEAGGASALQAA